MMRQVTSINWRYIGDAIPAFVTLMFIPFSYSAAYGLIAGLTIYVALNGMAYLTELVSGGRIVPDDQDSREYWSRKFMLAPSAVSALTTLLSQTTWQRTLVLQSRSRYSRSSKRWSQNRQFVCQKRQFFLAPREDRI